MRGTAMGKRREAAVARLQRLQERRREKAKLRALFGVEREGILRELMELAQRTMGRRRSERERT